MNWKSQYEKGKEKLLNDGSICEENRKLFGTFFEYQEVKLRRINNIICLDLGSYRTLLGYLRRFRCVNQFFNNKPWESITKEDIQQVYDDLEDGHILNSRGKPFQDKAGFYSKVFKSKPFALAGKAELAKEVIAYTSRTPDKQVRFVPEKTFQKLISTCARSHHLALYWLAWDVGENVGALLQLRKRDFVRQINQHNDVAEYLVRLDRTILKRSRRARTEPTLYPETTRYLDMVLSGLQEDEKVFKFGHRYALQVIKRASAQTGAVCEPAQDCITWKDLRSGMACNLLNCGWSRDEVNARLGHTPSSKEIDAYINFLALDRHKPKKKMEQARLEDVRHSLNQTQQREKLTNERMRQHHEENRVLRQQLEATESRMNEIQQKMDLLLARI